MKLFRPSIRTLTGLAVLLGVLCAAVSAGAALAPQVTFLNRVTQQVKTPVRLASDQFSNLYVADPRGGGIQKYDHTGSFLTTFPLKGVRGVAVTPTGDLVVSRGSSASVLDSSSGAEKFTLGQGAGQFRQATGIAVDDTGRIYVADSLDNCIQVFGADGKPVTIAAAAAGKPANSFGSGGSQAGQFSLPTGITFEKVSRQLAVADTLNGRIQFFATDGTFQKTLGSRGTGAVQFTSPQTVAFEYTKAAVPAVARLYVVDAFQAEVQIIDPAGAGSALGTIGGYGTTPGKLAVPADALFDQATSRLIVANGQGNLTVYGINLTTQPTPDITPPILTLFAVPTTVSSNSVIISGTVETEATLSITLKEGATLAKAVAGPVSSVSKDGVVSFWSTVITGLTPNADTTISIIAKDSAANATEQTAIVTYNPAAVKVTINRVTSPTNSSSLLLTGTMDVGATVALSANTTAFFGAVTYPTTTTWQSSVSSLVEGDNVISATASSASSTAATTVIITLVTTPPKLNVSTLPDGSITSSPLLNVSGELPVDANFDSLTINGQPVPVVTNAFGTSLQLATGKNVISSVATDKAGNTATDTRTITYDPALTAVTITEPSDGATVNVATVNFSGAAASGSSVTLRLYNDSDNGTPFTAITRTGNAWSAQNVPLFIGLNTIVAEAVDAAGAKVATKVTLVYAPQLPALAVTGPVPFDFASNSATQTLSGTVAPGATINATLSGPAGAVILPPLVNVKADGTFTATLAVKVEGTYTLAITATDPLGNSVTTYRSLVYDVSPPRLTVDPANPRRVTFTEGTPVARDKNGQISGAVITRNADGSVTIDLPPTVTFDPATLDIHAVDAAGNSTRNGDINGTGKVDIVSALKALRVAVGLDAAADAERLRADVAPLVNGVPTPDGVIDIFDVVYILEKIVGLH